MKIRLENIGIVQNSTLSLDGLTVITGKNNSGKTTVGKALYSLLDAVCNLHDKAKKDRHYYIQKQLADVESTLKLFRYMRLRTGDQRTALLSNFPALSSLLDSDYRRVTTEANLEQFANDLARELMNFDASILNNIETSNELTYYKRSMLAHGDSEKKSFSNIFDEQRNSALLILAQLFGDLNKDPELIDYARESINQTLQIEFANQIQPVKVAVPYSKIELSSEFSVLFDITIKNNNIVNNDAPVYFVSPFKRVYLIDDPFILDDILSRRMYRDFQTADTETILNSNRIYSHNYKLKTELRNSLSLSIFEQTVLDDSLKHVKEKIDQIIPGTFESSLDGNYYVKNGAKLRISNLATGSKMFSIVKMLLEKGKLDSNTMLILDEPEAHLHPQWQNAFAEIIVLLVKELNVNILLTTHSPNFMLAIDAYMRKYNISDKTNFYQTDVIDDNGLVRYRCVNDDMGKIYQDFLQYLSEAKMLRTMYFQYAEE